MQVEHPTPPSVNDLLTLQGDSEIDGELLRSLLEDSGIETFHVPTAYAALLGRASGIRFAIRQSDRPLAEEALAAAGHQFKDFIAAPGAYNVDEPLHRTFGRRSADRWLPWLLLAVAAGLCFGLWFCGAFRS